MKNGIGSSRANHLSERIEVRDHAGLVVHRHERHNTNGSLLKHVHEFAAVDIALAIDPDDPPTERSDGIEHGVVLDGAADRNSLAASEPEDRKVVRFRSTAREDDVARSRANEFGEFLSSIVDGPSGITSESVRARWIGVSIGEEGQHRLDRLGTHWSRRSMIEVRRHASRVPVRQLPDRGQTHQVTSPSSNDPGLYGRSFAEIYDEWYGDAFDTAGAVEALLRLSPRGSILELGVGTGRLALPIAATGRRVVGIDASEEMLDQLRLREGAGSIVTVCGDMASVADELGREGISDTFRLAFCAFNTLLNLNDVDSLTRCLAQTRSLLEPNGRLVIEAFVPVDHASIPAHSLSPARVRSDAAVFIETRFNPVTSILDGQHIEVRSTSVSRRPWSVLLFGPENIDDAAERAGLVLVDRWSDWSGADFNEASTTHISMYAPTM